MSAIAIATPARDHAKLALEALEAGKNIFVEKPLALRIADAEAACEQADRTGRILMVGHLLQYHPAFVRLSELVAAGKLGRLQYIYSNRPNLGRDRKSTRLNSSH